MIVTAGALAGRGTIDGNVTVKPGASLRPGSPSGVLTGKTITLESGAEIEIELHGTTRGGSHGALVCQTVRVTGAILEVSLASAFRPAAEERFDIIDGTLVGRFAQVKLPALAPDLAWDLSLLYTSGTLVVKEVPRERFRRGDSTADGRLDISDSIQALGHLFLGGAPPACPDASDANDDAIVDISDVIYVLSLLFTGGAAPPAPGAETCGTDPSADDLAACAHTEGDC